jgi:hypothetical protein
MGNTQQPSGGQTYAGQGMYGGQGGVNTVGRGFNNLGQDLNNGANVVGRGVNNLGQGLNNGANAVGRGVNNLGQGLNRGVNNLLNPDPTYAGDTGYIGGVVPLPSVADPPATTYYTKPVLQPAVNGRPVLVENKNPVRDPPAKAAVVVVRGAKKYDLVDGESQRDIMDSDEWLNKAKRGKKSHGNRRHHRKH